MLSDTFLSISDEDLVHPWVWMPVVDQPLLQPHTDTEGCWSACTVSSRICPVVPSGTFSHPGQPAKHVHHNEMEILDLLMLSNDAKPGISFTPLSLRDYSPLQLLLLNQARTLPHSLSSLNNMAKQVRTAVIVGCGVIGMGWGVLFLSRGIKVILSDPVEGAEAKFKQYILDAKFLFEGRGDYELLSTNYEFVADVVSRLNEADFVQEVRVLGDLDEKSPHVELDMLTRVV